MKVHSINCATMCPPARGLLTGAGAWFAPGRMICHCWLLETREGLVLVDTGLGTADLATPADRLGLPFRTFLQPRLDPAETAIAQVRALGFDPADVRHIVATHLDVDHAGGLADFPQATVHLTATELDAALRPQTLYERERYRPAHWAHGPKWAPREAGGEGWHGFAGVQALFGSEPDLLLVPLTGHTRGQTGVAVRTADGWRLHAGDAYYHHGALAEPPAYPPLLHLFELLGQADAGARVANVARLRALAGTGEVDIVCAHDPDEFDRCCARYGAGQAQASTMGAIAPDRP